MTALTLHAPAKLNLALHITGKRADGYHLLESLVVFTQFGDTVTVAPADALTLEVNGEFAEQAGGGNDNLVLRAARALQMATGATQGAHITLTKNIPVGAGLGGGSADAAAVLKGLQQCWNVHLPAEKLDELALILGADIPMCLRSTPLIASSIGEVLTPLNTPLPPLFVVLVHPRVPLLSKDVYAALNYPESGEAVGYTKLTSNNKDVLAWLKAATRNDLQRPAIAVSPIVAELLLAMETGLPEPALVRMTGSGACCFALFEDEGAAARYGAQIQDEYPHWWVKRTRLNSVIPA